MRRRRVQLDKVMTPACFNSRLREEATSSPCRSQFGERVSTHASVRRRPWLNSSSWSTARFNSRLREEATGDFTVQYDSKGVSTHASVRRRLLAVDEVSLAHEFQLTPP